jgi:hypothetical protein
MPAPGCIPKPSYRCRSFGTIQAVCERSIAGKGASRSSRSPLQEWRSCSSSSCRPNHHHHRTWMMLAGQTGGQRSGCSTLLGPTQSQLGTASRTRHLPGTRVSVLLGSGCKERRGMWLHRKPSGTLRQAAERKGDTYALLELFVNGV